MENQFQYMSALDLAQQIKSKKVSSTELTTVCLQQIQTTDSIIHAYISLLSDSALATAKCVDDKVARGDVLGVLEGVPITIKDNFCTDVGTTTCSSKILENYHAPYNATVVDQLNAANMPILGKSNLDELAMGSSTENSAFFSTKNPWDVNRVPGGSSGGSAATVAAGQVPLALGSDTGGSIRQPASYCGIIGLKPTYGRVSRYGLVAFASSLDQIGPFTRSTSDCAALLSVIAGHDAKDSTSDSREVPDYLGKLTPSVKGMKIAVPAELMGQGIADDVIRVVNEAIDCFRLLGASIHRVSLPSLKYALSTYYIIAPAEASSNLSRYDGVRFWYRAADGHSLREMMERSRSEGFGPEVKRRIMIGTYVLSSGYYDAYYKRAQQVRTLMKHEFADSFKTYDLILSPTAPTPAFKFGDNTADPMQMYMNDMLTIPANLAGLPAISFPGGFSKEGLPIGVQLMGRAFDEQTMLNATFAFEKAVNGWPMAPFVGIKE